MDVGHLVEEGLLAGREVGRADDDAKVVAKVEQHEFGVKHTIVCWEGRHDDGPVVADLDALLCLAVHKHDQGNMRRNEAAHKVVRVDVECTQEGLLKVVAVDERGNIHRRHGCLMVQDRCLAAQLVEIHAAALKWGLSQLGRVARRRRRRQRRRRRGPARPYR